MNPPEAQPAFAAPTGSACAHREQPAMGYTQWHEDADRRMARGEQQHLCDVCGLYIWTEFWKSPNAHGEPRRTES